jgi:hypothetical protein
MHACMSDHSHIVAILIGVNIITSGRNSRKQQGVGACPLDSCSGICIHACARVPPCIVRGLLGLGMGASDWDFNSQLLRLLAEVHVASTVTRALAMYEQPCMRETQSIIEPQFAPLCWVNSDFQQLQQVQQPSADSQTK